MLLARSLRPRLQLALLLPVLVDRDSLSLVHYLQARMSGRWLERKGWLRSLDSNQGPSGYEPDELPLLHSAAPVYPPVIEALATGLGSAEWSPGTAFRSASRTRSASPPPRRRCLTAGHARPF